MKKRKTTAKKAARPMAGKRSSKTKRATSSPDEFSTIDYGDGVHGLMLVGSGYAWESIAKHVANQLGLAKSLHFDCEGSMFVVRSSDPSALAKLQTKLDPIRLDREKFKRLVTRLGES